MSDREGDAATQYNSSALNALGFINLNFPGPEGTHGEPGDGAADRGEPQAAHIAGRHILDDSAAFELINSGNTEGCLHGGHGDNKTR